MPIPLKYSRSLLQRSFLLATYLLFWCLSAVAQQVDAAAQTLVARSLAAFSGGKPVTSVTMSGTASWHYGSDQQTGTVQLTASADGSSRMELHLDKGTRIETQSAFNADPHCTWTGFDGVEHESALHNCWTGTVWFLPAITLQAGAGAKDAVLAATGNRLQQNRVLNVKRKKTAELIAKASASDLDIDPQNSLPISLSYNAHPDNDALTNIATEIRYSDYGVVNGVTLPSHIEKRINNNPVLVMNIDSVSINGGTPMALVAVH